MKPSAKCIAVLACFVFDAAVATPPQLYRQAAFESPVRADPDDLLQISGYGLAADDMVVYQAVADTTRAALPPRELPKISTAAIGVAAIVSAKDVPYSLTIKLPQSLDKDQSYALWVRTAGGEWSEPVYVNDARPLWFTPAYVYGTRSPADLPRELKVVGRNLQPSPGGSTRIRLIGPQRYSANAIIDGKSSPTMGHYVARLALPSTLAAGHYQVQLSRDGVSWLEVRGQTFEVRSDPARLPEYPVSDPRFGGCAANDGADDTECIVRAVAAAAQAGGGVVTFGPGSWNLLDPAHPGVLAGEGIVVPAGVQLKGAGADSTYLLRHPAWVQKNSSPAFTFEGDTVVSGFTFKDVQIYQPRDDVKAFLQLGEEYRRVAAAAKDAVSAVVDDVTITRNTFDRTFVAIAHAGLPISRLFITFNTFGAYNSAIELTGDQTNMTYKYRIDDSVIDYNTFMPGSKLDMRVPTGALAGEIGAGYRVDFSGNNADGSATRFLYSPEDAPGWRAAFFWNMNGNIEEQLVSQNEASCTGDKVGDGEAIAYDNNTNTFGMSSVADVVNATPTSVTMSAPLAARQHGQDVPLATYYIDHWAQLVDGPGVGQVRKIIGYSIDPISHWTTLNVAPRWDVTPVARSTRIVIGREFWQVYTVDNVVDERRPTCQKSNRSRHDAGGIVLWAQSADSIIEGNRQYDSDGILVQQAYILPEKPCSDCLMDGFFQSSLEIRANLIDGEYDWDAACSASGILAGIAAAPWNDALPPKVGFGVSISHNTIRHADAQWGGAIALLNSWYSGPEPHRWPLSDNMLIHHNTIEEISGARAVPGCGASPERVGINFPRTPIAWRTVLYANSCHSVSESVGGVGGADTVRVCPSSVSSSCECP